MQNKGTSTCLEDTKSALSSRGPQNAVLQIVKFFGGLRAFIVRSGKFPLESVTNSGWNDTVGGCFFMLCLRQMVSDSSSKRGQDFIGQSTSFWQKKWGVRRNAVKTRETPCLPESKSMKDCSGIFGAKFIIRVFNSS